MSVALRKIKPPTADNPRPYGDLQPIADLFDRDRTLAKLFALPVPPPPAKWRTYPITTPLGRIMRLRRLMIQDVIGLGAKNDVVGMPNARVMTELLAGRRRIDHYRVALGRALQVDERIF